MAKGCSGRLNGYTSIEQVYEPTLCTTPCRRCAGKTSASLTTTWLPTQPPTSDTATCALTKHWSPSAKSQTHSKAPLALSLPSVQALMLLQPPLILSFTVAVAQLARRAFLCDRGDVVSYRTAAVTTATTTMTTHSTLPRAATTPYSVMTDLPLLPIFHCTGSTASNSSSTACENAVQAKSSHILWLNCRAASGSGPTALKRWQYVLAPPHAQHLYKQFKFATVHCCSQQYVEVRFALKRGATHFLKSRHIALGLRVLVLKSCRHVLLFKD